jgi:hypothetical protein
VLVTNYSSTDFSQIWQCGGRSIDSSVRNSQTLPHRDPMEAGRSASRIKTASSAGRFQCNLHHLATRTGIIIIRAHSVIPILHLERNLSSVASTDLSARCGRCCTNKLERREFREEVQSDIGSNATLLAFDRRHSFTYLLRASVYVGMTKIAQRDQVFQGIISERAAKTQMMNLQLACTAILTPPAIAN